MDYGIDFSDNVQKRKKKLIFIAVFVVLVIMFVAFFFRNSNSKVVSKVATVISKPIIVVYDLFNKDEIDSMDLETLRA